RDRNVTGVQTCALPIYNMTNKNTTKNISIEKLFPFEGHPFKVRDNEEMECLAESIQQNGVLSPIIVRPKENTPDEYEIISGHRQIGRASCREEVKITMC